MKRTIAFGSGQVYVVGRAGVHNGNSDLVIFGRLKSSEGRVLIDAVESIIKELRSS